MTRKKRKKTDQKAPVCILLVAMSIDGKITNGVKEGSDWTSKEDARFFQKELDRCDVAIMGRKTFEAIKRPLTPRTRVVFSTRQTGAECENVISGDIRELKRRIAQHGWKRIAVVGGTSVYDWFLSRDLVDEMYITIEPVLFGSGKAFTGMLRAVGKSYKLISSRRLNPKGTLLLHYERTTDK